MAPLPPDLRRDLEHAVISARETAEQGAGNALAVLGVNREPAPAGLSPEDRSLRVALRASARSLGNGLTFDGIPALTEEIAYAAWHRMLFARFLAESGLLVEPRSGAPVSMEDVADLAKAAGEPDRWVLAARYAAEMLPGIFGTDDPTTRVALAPDDRLRLEKILQDLPSALFTADDALGWVYQFWQSKRKDDVNRKGKKVGAGDLAPVTQLFTEHYMVRFLLENSLGAWWAGRHPDSPLLREWEYLRYRDDGTPAAGVFEGWPESAAEVTVMDPCMGSGHFLVAAADMLRRMRMEEEGLSAADAARAVIADNLFGLELDPRCTQLGAFALAFDAWKAAGGYRELPVPNVACSGIAVKGQLDDWRRLAGDDDNLKAALERLYELFLDAPELGSLIDPRAAAGEGLWAVDPDRLLAKLDQALARETEDPAAAVFGAAAQGSAKAARLLSGRYWLVATNPPFLGQRKMPPTLQRYCMTQHKDASQDLATVMLDVWRVRTLASGICSFVLPQNWIFGPRSTSFRGALLGAIRLTVLSIMGEGAFASSAAAGAFVCLFIGVRERSGGRQDFAFITTAESADVTEKERGLRAGPITYLSQAVKSDEEFRLHIYGTSAGQPLTEFCLETPQGVITGDADKFRRAFWEVNRLGVWRPLQSAVTESALYSGRHYVLDWRQQGRDMIRPRMENPAFGRQGVAVSLMRELPATLYGGDLFDSNLTPLVPRDPSLLPALWVFASSPEFVAAARRIEQRINFNSGTVAKIPFDLGHWTKVAAERYPDGLPKPKSDDPTQWLFRGTIAGSEAPLHVALARLLGYRWPDQSPDALDTHADPDGIVCLPPVAGDAPAHERLEALLAAAYGSDWTGARRAEVLAGTGGNATTLDAWLRDEAFAQHARLFHNRPFIWHLWDGRKDGFAALLHYHRLDRATLEKLTYHHLGDWIERQEADSRQGVAGADQRLKAARELQGKLRGILEGEPPYDIYVRWKPLAEQPVGWEPDLDDGVRLNIRPFVTAGVLRASFTINWNKDRGTDLDGSERINDRHLSRAEKLAARGQG